MVRSIDVLHEETCVSVPSVVWMVRSVFFFQQGVPDVRDLGFYTTQGCRLSPMQFESLRVQLVYALLYMVMESFAFAPHRGVVVDLYLEMFVLFLLMKQLLLSLRGKLFILQLF